jgi:hypothetical protein
MVEEIINVSFTIVVERCMEGSSVLFASIKRLYALAFL